MVKLAELVGEAYILEETLSLGFGGVDDNSQTVWFSILGNSEVVGVDKRDGLHGTETLKAGIKVIIWVRERMPVLPTEVIPDVVDVAFQEIGI